MINSWVHLIIAISKYNPPAGLILWMNAHPQGSYEDLAEEMPMEYLWLTFIPGFPADEGFFINDCILELDYDIFDYVVNQGASGALMW